MVKSIDNKSESYVKSSQVFSGHYVSQKYSAPDRATQKTAYCESTALNKNNKCKRQYTLF